MEIPHLLKDVNFPLLKKPVVFADLKKKGISLDWEKIDKSAEATAMAHSHLRTLTDPCFAKTAIIIHSLLDQGIAHERIGISGVSKRQPHKYEHVWPTLDREIISSVEDRERYGDLFPRGKPVEESVYKGVIRYHQALTRAVGR